MALWSAFSAQAVGLTVGFVLAEPTTLRPDYSNGAVVLGMLLVAGFCAVVSFAIALARRKSDAAWWAGASATALLAVMVTLVWAGTGGWFPWCATSLYASLVAAFVSLLLKRPEPAADGGGIPARRAGKAAATVAAVALVVALFSGGGMEDVDYTGTWTAREHDLTLKLTDGDYGEGSRGHYTLHRQACSENADWNLDHPQMTTSVQVWLIRDRITTPCLPGTGDIMLRVAGGTVASPS